MTTNPTGNLFGAKERPLEGLRVIDLTRALAGPYATLLLAGLGAEVIKIEDPRGGDLARENSPYVGRDGIVVERCHEDDVSVSHLTRARGKYGVALDFKKPGAQQVFRDLVRGADIVVENFTSGTADRLGIGYDVAREENPGIIYCSLSGFGATAPEGGKAMDIIIQALSGAMYASGGPNEPPVRIGIPIADMLAPVFAVIGILAALEQRHRTGHGQHIDVSMLGALTSFVAIENWSAMAAAGMQARTGLTVQRLSPFGVFECADGYVAVVAVHEKLAQGLFRAMEQPELSQDRRFCNRDARVANAAELEALINGWSRTLPTQVVVKKLEAEGVPVAPVRHPEDALVDPRVVARQETMEAAHPNYDTHIDLRTAGIPIVFSDARTGFDDVLPVRVGEHGEAILSGHLGYTPERIAELRAGGVI
ncbi:CoA transferase [Sphingobium jiangsuense]|uniref:Crotonobetainyl-CoA:carnitine CoA-transferase CaiB-like acyl-CoA transferase n=1 Tax=Sphingobium jiangsuense TaxID=870476 RepID=A0A7W6BQR4_9SPHN|nr:CaiB/BaiF CoA-transferase family protein [Sphingobium jiangsuense]MBB3926124.1 crotonobetainyl-CoA:carnitine CoA-transferase CaiB-like acyl-CoA transferase [Sphingobium jiangsuense]GLS99160.1 CoA transferase [Sphingobium jiangsuense]